MKLSKTPSAEELQVISRFEVLRKMLVREQYREHWCKPLAFWVLPTDRRLPLAFLGRTLGEVLNTPFAELCATPGVGQKKIRSFLKLLSRVANTDLAALPIDSTPVVDHAKPASGEDISANGFDPAVVSEMVWDQWRASVLRHGLGHEPLGRFAPSLRNMTRVIWNRPLHVYAGCTLAQIRSMKTHGEKRVRAILETFYSVHTLVGRMGIVDHLVVRIVPRCIDAAETWVGGRLQSPGVPSSQEVFERFVAPLLEQVRIDTTRQIVHLAENRLGIDGPRTSVRQAARQMGLTRARVYQLLNAISDVMEVRWPLGRHQVYQLRDKLQTESTLMANPPDLAQFHAAIELFYPGSRRGAAGPLDRVGRTTAPCEPAAQPIGPQSEGHDQPVTRA